MAVTHKVLVTGTLLTNSTATYYTVPASTKAKIHEFTFYNSHTSAVGVNLYLVASGDSAADKNKVLDAAGFVLAADETRTWSTDQLLEASGTIQADAGTTGVVAIRCSGVELT